MVITAVGCKAQSSPDNAQINRRIEVLVRSQFQVPPDVNVTIGARAKSDTPGYDSLPITFGKAGGKQTIVTFLLSQDGNTLARFEKFDLSKNPADVVSTTNRPIRGNDQAKVTIVNFDDLECPYCGRMHQELFPSTLEHYKGLVKIVYKDDPLVELHPWALHAAVDANCLAEQNPSSYWTYVDYLHAHGDEVSGPDRDPVKAGQTLDRLTREQGGRDKLNTDKLNACVTKQDESGVKASMQEAAGLNIDGTPTLFINGERVTGAMPTDQLWQVIDRALVAAGIQPPPAASASRVPTGNN
jgi:protein-disulfide isomerase